MVTGGRPDLIDPSISPRRTIMIAHVGDRIIVEGTYLSEVRRVGIITAVSHGDGAPPYQVRWLDDGHTSLIFPGAEARIEAATTGAGSATS
jgi:hypothetical protein